MVGEVDLSNFVTSLNIFDGWLYSKTVFCDHLTKNSNQCQDADKENSKRQSVTNKNINNKKSTQLKKDFEKADHTVSEWRNRIKSRQIYIQSALDRSQHVLCSGLKVFHFIPIVYQGRPSLLPVLQKVFGNHLATFWATLTEGFTKFKSAVSSQPVSSREEWSAHEVGSMMSSFFSVPSTPLTSSEISSTHIGPSSVILGLPELVHKLESTDWSTSELVSTWLNKVYSVGQRQIGLLLSSAPGRKISSSVPDNDLPKLAKPTQKVKDTIQDIVLSICSKYGDIVSTLHANFPQVLYQRLVIFHSFRGDLDSFESRLSGLLSGRFHVAGELFFFRTGLDKSIRRCHINEPLKMLWLRKDHRLFSSVVLSLCGFDYIFSSNLVFFILACPFSLLTPVLFSQFENPWDVCTQLRAFSSSVKWNQTEVGQWSHELGNLAGFGNPPWPGFDPEQSAEELAAGGNTFPPVLDSVWPRLVQVLIEFSNPRLSDSPPVQQSFRDYVASGVWATAGSSNVGHFEVEIASEGTFRFKSKKNTVPDLFTTDELISMARTEEPLNTAIVKAETGKIRTAVSAPIGSYLLQSYWNTYLNSYYTRLPGATLDETTKQQISRSTQLSLSMEDIYCLPFDYASFDHQPSLQMIWTIVRESMKVASSNGAECTDWMVESMRRSIFNARLTVSKDKAVPVTGGLLSGMRWTSLVGNVWNTCMSVLASSLPFCLTNTSLSLSLPMMIRGDDTHFSGGYGQLGLVRVGYACLGVDGNSNKFRILPNRTEFLRESIDQKGCFGLAVRSIPGLTQRKPWTDDPRDPNSNLAQLVDVVRTLERRGGDVRHFLKVFTETWSRITKSSPQAAIIPRQLGGLGLGLMPLTSRRFELTDYEDPHYTVRMDTPWRTQHWTMLARKYAMSEHLAPTVAQDDINSIMTAGRLRTKKVPRLKYTQEYSLPVSHLLDLHFSPEQIFLPSRSYFLGLYAKKEKEWEVIRAFSRVDGSSPIKVFGARYPDFLSNLRVLERKGLTRKDAIDVLFGSFPQLVSVNLRSILTSFVVGKSARIFLNGGKRSRASAYFRIQQVQDYITTSCLRNNVCFRQMNAV